VSFEFSTTISTSKALGSGTNSSAVCIYLCLTTLRICTPHPIFTGDKIEKNEMGWACGALVEERGVYRVFVWKPDGKRPLGRPRRRWVDNIRMDLQELDCGYMDWIGLAQDRDS